MKKFLSDILKGRLCFINNAFNTDDVFRSHRAIGKKMSDVFRHEGHNYKVIGITGKIRGYSLLVELI